jgi:NitT/TauT family transport system permease protein/taurine transport system permease protein
MKQKENNTKYILVSVLSLCTVVFIWYLLTDVLGWVNTNMLPSPVKVFRSFIRKFYDKNPDGSTMLVHLAASLQVALSGYSIGLVVGIPLGICMAWYEKFDNYARPLFDLIRPVPGIAWIPLMIILFGIGVMSKAMIVFLSSFTACVINSYSGVKQTKTVHMWVGQTFGYSNRKMLFKIGIPTALPMILTGMKAALGTSWGALIAAELLASTAGLGFMIQQARGVLRPDIIIAGMLMIGAVGAFLSYLITLLEKVVLKGGWW